MTYVKYNVIKREKYPYETHLSKSHSYMFSMDINLNTDDNKFADQLRGLQPHT